jgi:hypothetical protein
VDPGGRLRGTQAPAGGEYLYTQESEEIIRIWPVRPITMFPRLAEHYRSVVQDLVMSLQALAISLQRQNLSATCYVCGDGVDSHGASFVADLGDGHMVRFLVSDFGISWVESRNGHELVKLEGADAIQELERVSSVLVPVAATLPAAPRTAGTGSPAGA